MVVDWSGLGRRRVGCARCEWHWSLLELWACACGRTARAQLPRRCERCEILGKGGGGLAEAGVFWKTEIMKKRSPSTGSELHFFF